MAISLEQQLKAQCEGLPLTFPADLGRIRDAAFRIWEAPRLPYFTDHKAQTHSTFIIQVLGDVLEQLQAADDNRRLSPYELFVLLAACYLHDVGMQDLQIAGSTMDGGFTADDYVLIRKRHPERSKDIILAGTLNVGNNIFTLPAWSAGLATLVALVCQAHGSEYFDDTVQQLKQQTAQPGNLPFRGDLVAALLMIGDELHLHEERAAFPQLMDLSTLSSLHYHVNHYVTGVSVGGTAAGRRQILVSLEFPQGSQHYQQAVCEWLSAKLLMQIRRVNPILRYSTKGLLSFEEVILFVEGREAAPGIRKQMPTAVEALLFQHVEQARTVDREDVFVALQRQPSETTVCVVIEDRADSDWPFLLKRLEADARAQAARLLLVSFDLEVARSPADVVERLREQLGPTIPESRAFAYASFLAELREATRSLRILLLLEHPDLADEPTRRWMADVLLPALLDTSMSLSVVVAVHSNVGVLDRVQLPRRHVKLCSFTQDDLKKHNRDRLGYPEDEATTKAEEQIGYSMGQPVGVYLGLEAERRRGIVRR